MQDIAREDAACRPGGTFDKPAGAKELSADSDRPERVKTIEAEMIQFEK